LFASNSFCILPALTSLFLSCCVYATPASKSVRIGLRVLLNARVTYLGPAVIQSAPTGRQVEPALCRPANWTLNEVALAPLHPNWIFIRILRRVCHALRVSVAQPSPDLSAPRNVSGASHTGKVLELAAHSILHRPHRLSLTPVVSSSVAVCACILGPSPRHRRAWTRRSETADGTTGPDILGMISLVANHSICPSNTRALPPSLTLRLHLRTPLRCGR